MQKMQFKNLFMKFFESILNIYLETVYKHRNECMHHVKIDLPEIGRFGQERLNTLVLNSVE